MDYDIVNRLRDRSQCWQVDGAAGIGEDALLDRGAADEIERLRALCNDLYHDATCAESFCRLCGEGIREWENNRG